jgi:hypothetical protein
MCQLIYLFLVEKAVWSLLLPLTLQQAAEYDLTARSFQFIIRKGAESKPRMKSKLYIFNSFGMLGVYLVVSILNFVLSVFSSFLGSRCGADEGSSRITRLEDGQCIIGMRKIAMIPLITFDILVNVSGQVPSLRMLHTLMLLSSDLPDHFVLDSTTKSVLRTARNRLEYC